LSELVAMGGWLVTARGRDRQLRLCRVAKAKATFCLAMNKRGVGRL